MANTDEHITNDNEKRVQILEANLVEIHRLLTAIQTKLIGSLETEKPGLVSDLKALQDRVVCVERELAIIKVDYVQRTSITTLENEIVASQKDRTDLWKEIRANSKFRWMTTGGLTVINVLLWIYIEFKK